MTALAPTVATRPTTPSAPTSPNGDPLPLPLLLLSEVALTLVTLAAVFGLRRVFVGLDWFGLLAVHAVLAHTTAAVLRRLHFPALLAVPAAALVALIAISATYAGETTTLGIPGTTSVDTLRLLVDQAWSAFGDVKAPTEALDGFLVATAVAIWAGAVLSDWAAFRLHASFEALLPATTLFVLAAILGADASRLLVTTAWISAALVFLLVRRAERLGVTARWVGDRQAAGPRSLLVMGAALAAVAVAGAALVGPRIPGADSDAIVALRDLGDDGSGSRVTISPLVDIRSRLVEQSNVEVFTVRSDVRSYWRLTSLDRFDGTIWSSNGSYGKADGDLADGVRVLADRLPATQQFTVRALSQIWLPAAFEPQAITGVADIRYDEVSGTLIVDNQVPTSDGLTFTVTSAIPIHDPTALAGATTDLPADVASRYLGLPEDFSSTVAELARNLTAGSTSRYEQSLRLQNFFRTFTYDLSGTERGHGQNVIERFVFEDRRGYCEQFAGTFAAMARSLGIPARVAVGFTPGETLPDDPGVYHVRGEHAHAWPEVFLGEYGWVAFEPTPGRGAPLAEAHTGVQEEQARPDSPAETETNDSPPVSIDPTVTPDTEPLLDLGDPGGAGAPTTAVGQGGDGARRTAPAWIGVVAVTATALVVLTGAYLGLVLVVGALRRDRRRRRAAAVPGATIALAWEEAMTSLRRIGITLKDGDTHAEVAHRVEQSVPVASPPVSRLAGVLETATFSPDPPGKDQAAAALRLADDVEAATLRTAGTSYDWIRLRFHPRRLRD